MEIKTEKTVERQRHDGELWLSPSTPEPNNESFRLFSVLDERRRIVLEKREIFISIDMSKVNGKKLPRLESSVRSAKT
jgi:hypothetical protein